MSKRGIATVATVAVASFGAYGCGSSSSSGGASVAEAKQKLLDDCHAGHAGDMADLRQCKCILARVESKPAFKTADQLDRLRKRMAKNDVPPVVAAAGAACPKGK